MTISSPENRIEHGLELETRKIQELLEPFRESVDVSLWTNLGINDGGFLTATIPISQINPSTFPINHEHSASIAREMREDAEKTGGTGQRDSINLVTVIGQQGLEITDGFHRHDAVKINEHDVIHAVLTPNITQEELLDLKIAATRKFDLELTRVVELAQEVWELTEWSKIEGLNVIDAFHLRLSKNPDEGKRFGLSKAQRKELDEWTRDKETRWHLSAEKVHAHLKGAEDHEPEIVALFRQLGDKGDLGFTPKVADKVVPMFSIKIDEEFITDTDMVSLLAKVANDKKLTYQQCTHLAVILSTTPEYEEAVEIALGYDPSAKIPKQRNRGPSFNHSKKTTKQPAIEHDSSSETQSDDEASIHEDQEPIRRSEKPVSVEEAFKRASSHELLELLGDALAVFRKRYNKGEIPDNEHNKARVRVLGNSLIGLVDSNPHTWGFHRGDYGTNLLVYEAAKDIATYILDGGATKPKLPIQQSQQTTTLVAEVRKILHGKQLTNAGQDRLTDFASEWRRRFPSNQQA